MLSDTITNELRALRRSGRASGRCGCRRNSGWCSLPPIPGSRPPCCRRSSAARCFRRCPRWSGSPWFSASGSITSSPPTRKSRWSRWCARKERLRLPSPPGEEPPAYLFESLDYPVADRRMEAFYAEFPADAPPSEPHRHGSAEFIYVFSGRLTVDVDGEETHARTQATPCISIQAFPTATAAMAQAPARPWW